MLPVAARPETVDLFAICATHGRKGCTREHAAVPLADAPAARSGPMGEAEARACVERISHSLRTALPLLLELQERGGWRALGYVSWRACVEAEFGWAKSHAYRLLAMARLERDLELSPIGESAVVLKEWHVRQIAALPAAERRDVVLSLARTESAVTQRDLRGVLIERSRARTQAARNGLLHDAPAPLPGSIDLRVADAAALPWPDGAVDLWVTSPPYRVGKDYGAGGGHDDMDYPSYLALARAWAAELYRVGSEQARLCLNVALDTSRGGPQSLYADWVAVLAAAGWTYQTTIIWADNDTSRHQARGGPTPATVRVSAPVEVIGVFHRGDWHLDPVGRHGDLEHEEWLKWTHGLWTFPNNHAQALGHQAAFAPELPRRCIKLFSFPGAVVGDPFLGSGTTAAVAAQLGRRVLGSDISPEYVALARARVARDLGAAEREP